MTVQTTAEPVAEPEDDPRFYWRLLKRINLPVRAVTLQLFMRLRLTSGCRAAQGPRWQVIKAGVSKKVPKKGEKKRELVTTKATTGILCAPLDTRGQTLPLNSTDSRPAAPLRMRAMACTCCTSTLLKTQKKSRR